MVEWSRVLVAVWEVQGFRGSNPTHWHDWTIGCISFQISMSMAKIWTQDLWIVCPLLELSPSSVFAMNVINALNAMNAMQQTFYHLLLYDRDGQVITFSRGLLTFWQLNLMQISQMVIENVRKIRLHYFSIFS